jgi:hypothetical protein
MLKKISEQNFFEQFTKLTGKQVRLSIRSKGKEIEGKILNAMFDSFLLQTKQGNEVVTYDDMLFFESMEEA